MEKLHIVYASSEEYAPVLQVSIVSLLDNKKEATFYQIYIIVEKMFSEQFAQLFSEVVNRFSGFEIQWVVVGDAFANTRVNAFGVGKESNYRLLITELLDEGVDKCLYLDADTLVLEDLYEIFQINISEKYISGLHPRHFLKTATQDYTTPHFDMYEKLCQKYAGDLRYDEYVGAGVLLMNLKKMRHDHMAQVFFSEIPAHSGPIDQEILNACCYGHIGQLPLECCLDLHELQGEDWYRDTDQVLYQQLVEAKQNPVIIHFSDKYKPWKYLGIPYEKEWWRYAYAMGAAEYLWDNLVERNKIPITYFEEELAKVTHSLSYRIGRKITCIPRGIKHGVERLKKIRG